MMFISDKHCDLKSKSVSEIHFPIIWGSKLKKFPPWCPTDSANNKGNPIFGKKMAVEKSTWIKACKI